MKSKRKYCLRVSGSTPLENPHPNISADMIFNKREPLAMLSKPAVRVEDNAISKAYFVARELMHRYKTDPRFVRAELTVDSTGPLVKFYQRFGDITPEYTENGTRVVSLCKEEKSTPPEDADFWSKFRE